MAFEHYLHTDGKRLRCGFTTGSCAALAAQAATHLLLTGEAPARASIVTPKGIRVEADVVEPHLVEGASGEDGGADATDENAEAPTADKGAAREGCAICAVRKDAGDDIDVTDGVLVYARVSRSDKPGVHIEGGTGVGRITLPGLEQPVGAAAINSGPRAMIEKEALHAASALGYDGGLDVLISIPAGVELGAKTFNPQLGIEGGISVLGTSGIVEPKSLKALSDSIEVEIRQHAALGHRRLVVVPGNYGQAFAESIPLLSGIPHVSCANFIGNTLDFCAQYDFEEVLLIGHIGKMVKVAGGIMDTHSRMADCRTEIFCAHAAQLGASQETCRQLMAAATTDACLGILEQAGLLHETMSAIGDAIAQKLERRVAGAYRIETIVFSNVRGELYRSNGVEELLERWGAALSKGCA